MYIFFVSEDRLYDDNTKTLYRIALRNLRNTLERFNISEILIDSRNSRCIDKTKFECDYYQLLEGNIEKVNEFYGEYMFEYSWAESTLLKIMKLVGNKNLYNCQKQ